MRIHLIPLLLLAFCPGEILAADPIHLTNVDCAPYLDHVATDPGFYQYEPYFVKIHRCHGKHPVPNPKNEKCVPKLQNGEDSVEIIVVTKLGAYATLNITNHTECEQRCVISQQDCTPFQEFKPTVCGCSCKPSAGPQNCYAPFIWQQSACDCICPKDESSQVCAKRKVFSMEECGCTCKAKFYARCAKRKQVVSEDTCECVDPEILVGKSRSGCDGGVNGAMLAVVIIVEAFAIVFCYYFFYKYCYKQNYLGRKKDKNVSSGYYHNGDIPNYTVQARNSESTHEERENLTENTRVPDKDLIRQEERERVRLNGLSDKERIRLEEEDGDQYAGYYPEEEKSPLAPKYPNHHNGDMYNNYNDIMEVDGPPSSLDNHNLNIPPDYSDAISDLSEDDYAGSVTQV